MPLFDITSGIKAQYKSGATPQVAYDIMKKIVVTFAKRGYTIDWAEQKPPGRVVAQLGDKDGTDLKAEVDVVDEGTVTRCDIHIHGYVFLGGILGRLVSASTIQNRAQEKIKEMLDESFAGQPAKRAPTATAAAPKPAGPSTLPPGHPGIPASAKPAAAPVVAAVAAPSPAVATATVAAPSAVASSTTSLPAAAAGTVVETWAAVVERVLAGGAAPEPSSLITRAASAAGALGDATLIQFVQIGLVQVLAKSRGKKVDRAAAAQTLGRVGASAGAQVELAKPATTPLKAMTAAYALTAAVGEAVLKSLDDPPPPDDALHDIFGAAYERVYGEKTAAHARGSAVADKLEQVKEAYDADLLHESEMLVLRERVLASL